MEVFHLFPPLDKLVAEATAYALHLEALSAVECILDKLVRRVVPEEGWRSPTHDEGDGEMDQLQDLDQSGVSVAVVTDDMREEDKRSGLQVLLKMLQLSCDMVRSWSCDIVAAVM